MFNDCTYNKVKLLHELSSLSWFIQKHAHDDARAVKDSVFSDLLKSLDADLQKNIVSLKKNLSITE